MKALTFGFLLTFIGGTVLALHQSWLRIPANWVPWGDVALDEPPTRFARFQLNSLAADGKSCLMTLARSKLSYTPLPDRPLEGGCGLSSGVQIMRSQIPYSGVFEARCALVAALYWYERELVELAKQHLGQEIARIDHWGSYSCRNVNSRKEGRRSQHATANALDLAGFTLADGSTIVVRRDWGADNAKGRFLKAARDRACFYFNAVLGPDYNSLHRDHMHLDLGRARICR